MTGAPGGMGRRAAIVSGRGYTPTERPATTAGFAADATGIVVGAGVTLPRGATGATGAGATTSALAAAWSWASTSWRRSSIDFDVDWRFSTSRGAVPRLKKKT